MIAYNSVSVRSFTVMLSVILQVTCLWSALGLDRLIVLQGASKLNMHPRVPEQPKKGLPRQVVYAPSCVTRMMGPSSGDSEQASVHEKLLSLFDKAGYEVIYPEVCCLTVTQSSCMFVKPMA